MKAAEALRFCITAIILTVIVVACAGCATTSERTVYAKGMKITVHDNADCPDGSRNACATDGHVWLPVWATKDDEVHEISHLLGMMHTEWKQLPNGRLCATVYSQGNSIFPVGYLFCR